MGKDFKVAYSVYWIFIAWSFLDSILLLGDSTGEGYDIISVLIMFLLFLYLKWHTKKRIDQNIYSYHISKQMKIIKIFFILFFLVIISGGILMTIHFLKIFEFSLLNSFNVFEKIVITGNVFYNLYILYFSIIGLKKIKEINSKS